MGHWARHHAFGEERTDSMGYTVQATHGIPQCGCDTLRFDTFDEAQDAVMAILANDISAILSNDPDMDEHDAEELAASYTTITKDGE